MMMMITGQGLLDRRHMRHIEGVCTHLNNILVGNFYSYLQAHTQSQQPEIDRPQTEMGRLRVSAVPIITTNEQEGGRF